MNYLNSDLKISIITASFNSEKTIRDTLQSVVSQTYTSIEHIVVDGASKDNTIKIVKEFPHVSKIISEPDNGIYDAMNKGLRVATGEIIGILNSDDFLDNELVIEKITKEFLKTDAHIIYCNTLYGNFDSNPPKIIRHVKPGEFRRFRFKYGWMPSHPSVYIKKSIYNEYGLFDTSYEIAADYDLMVRFMYKVNSHCKYLPINCVRMRAGGISNSNFQRRVQAGKEVFKSLRKNKIKGRLLIALFKPLLAAWNIANTKFNLYLRK